MGSKTLTISLPSEMMGFLDENKTLSPSKLIQRAILDVQNSLKNNPMLLEANKEVERWKKFSKKLQEDLQKATNFIEDKQLWDEFTK